MRKASPYCRLYIFSFVLWLEAWFLPQCQSLLNFIIFLIGMTLKEAMEDMEAMEVHAMERVLWATILPQKPGPPVPTKTLPIGTERRDIYACENSRGNHKSSSLGEIQSHIRALDFNVNCTSFSHWYQASKLHNGFKTLLIQFIDTKNV